MKDRTLLLIGCVAGAAGVLTLLAGRSRTDLIPDDLHSWMLVEAQASVEKSSKHGSNVRLNLCSWKGPDSLWCQIETAGAKNPNWTSFGWVMYDSGEVTVEVG